MCSGCDFSYVPFFESYLDFHRAADDQCISEILLYLAAKEAKDKKEFQQIVARLGWEDELIAAAFMQTNENVLYVRGHPFYRKDYLSLMGERG